MPKSGEPAIVLNQLGMRFGAVSALEGLCGVFPTGQITGLVGPDAAGKTTLIRILAGLMEPSAGSVKLFGASPLEVSAKEPNSIGYMPQRFGLYEDLSVLDNLNLHARLRGVEGDERQKLFASLLAFTGLVPFTERLAGKLSGGMKQKLGIACALLGQPRLLLLDEPGVGVDPLSRRELWRMVQQLAGGGMTVVWSTAYLDEAERCPHVIMLDQGRVLFSGKPEDLTEQATGHVFAVTPEKGTARETLMYWTKREGVSDALVQGSRIRVVLKSTEAPDASMEALSPRLEDAYMMALGGINQENSPFAGTGIVADMQSPSIQAKALTKKFGSFVAANGISFSVNPGQIFGLLGPNGAGKSTTFRMLCGLSRPTSGECFVAGVNLLSAGSEARSRLGYMAQKFSLYGDLKVRENIRIFGRLYGLDPQKLRERAKALTAALELEPYLNMPAGTLPLGQKQRLALVCATLHNPSVLFLDEPTSGVDARTRRDFWKHITAMTQSGTAVLVTTHFMEEAEYCDSIALVYRGTLISMGAPDVLKAAMATERQPDPTMEEAFIDAITRYDKEHPQ